MPAKTRLLLALSIILLLLALGSLFAPFLVARAAALWLRYEAQRSGLTITTAEIRAPFLRPVEIRDLQIVRAGRDGAHFQMRVPAVQAALHLAALITRSQREPLIRDIRAEHARISLRGRAAEATRSIDWQAFAQLLPAQFDFSADEIRFEQSAAAISMENVQISGSTGRTGSLAISSVAIHAPFLRRTFADLHGVTRWQDDRLTLGPIHLLDGVDIDSSALDFSRLTQSHLGADLAVRIFDGNMRANFATDRADRTRRWEGAASASDVSLEQLAHALGFTQPLAGSLRASKFTFRGDPRDLVNASASAWLELNGFRWGERKADVIMLGGNLYESAVQLQELYIKQSHNELTLSGETMLGANWLNSDFRGDVFGSINNLGEFAELFGAAAKSFAGKVAIRGRVHAQERKVDGELALTGDALKIFREPVDSLTARLTLDAPRLQLDQLEIRRGEDFLRGSGQMQFSNKRSYEIVADSWCHELRGYDVRVPLLGLLTGTCFAQLDASGDLNASAISIKTQLDWMKLSAKGTLHRDDASIDTLSVALRDAAADFSGTVKIPDRKHISVTLTPVSDLRLPQGVDPTRCLRGIELRPGDAGAALSQIEISQREISLSANGTTQSFPLCRHDEEAGQPLRVSVLLPSGGATPTPPPKP